MVSKQVVCERGVAIGHGQDVVAEMREPGDPDGFILETPLLQPWGGLDSQPNNVPDTYS